MTPIPAYLVHWHAAQWCAESVSALLASKDVDVVVTVINNGGDLVLPPEVAVLEPPENLGFAAAANAALRQGLKSDAPYVLIGCHDARLAPDSLCALVEALEGDTGLAVVGPALNGAGDSEPDLDWIPGAVMLIRREVAETFRFDERFGSYVEDVDFCYRVRDVGWRVGRVGTAHAEMRGSVDPVRARVLMHANTLVFLARRRMARELVRRVVFLLSSATSQPSDRWDYLRALTLGAWRLAGFWYRSPDVVTSRVRW